MGTGSWGCSWLTRSIARPELPAVTGRASCCCNSSSRPALRPRTAPLADVRGQEAPEPGGNRRDRQGPAIGCLGV